MQVFHFLLSFSISRDAIQPVFRMDSFVLSETLKYLYMIFTDSSDLPIDLDNYILTTEAHFIPLSIGDTDNSEKVSSVCISML